jgi:predicted dehydrogenase
MPDPIVSFGLIGLGVHGVRYAAHLLEDVPGARLVAVCRRDRKAGAAWAAQRSVRYHADPDALLADPGVDAVAVVTTPDLHPGLIERAAAEGKHVLVEKPLAVNGAEAARIARAVEGRGITVMVAQTLRFNSVVRTLGAHVASIAPLHAVSLSQRMEPGRLAWQADPAVAGGGNILHTGIHLFDLLRHLTGEEVDRVSCVTARVINPGLEDSFGAVMRLSSGRTIALVEGSKATRSRSGRIELAGEGGQLVGDHVQGCALRVSGYERADLSPPAPVPTVRETLRAFLEALHAGGPPPITVNDGMRAVEIADACYRSAAEGRPVPVERAQRGGLPC